MSFSGDVSEDIQVVGAAGSGGSARVFRAVHRPSGMQVALKVLGPGHDDRRIRREATVLSRLNHVGIVPLRSVGRFRGESYLVTDWVHGTSLAERLDHEGPFSVDRALLIFDQLAAALHATHCAGIVHRDLSPRNVMIDSSDRITIIDFGLSWLPEATTITDVKSTAGTPEILAPEVIEGADPTSRSDQYAAAILLYRMLTSSSPFPETPSITGVLHHHLRTLPQPISELEPSIPISIDRTIDRALSKNPNERFDDMAQMSKALRQEPAASRLGTRSLLLLAALLVVVAAGAALFVGFDREATVPAARQLGSGSKPTSRSEGDELSMEMRLVARSNSSVTLAWGDLDNAVPIYRVQWRPLDDPDGWHNVPEGANSFSPNAVSHTIVGLQPGSYAFRAFGLVDGEPIFTPDLAVDLLADEPDGETARSPDSAD